jgi:RHS repeat-associated protein
VSSFVYESSTGRVKTYTDPKLQTSTYDYTVDGLMQTVTYTNATVATPPVTYTYDTAYVRMATMVDGSGTTTLTYHPAGVLGAGQMASLDGPLANDTQTFVYDELGREVTQGFNGVNMTHTFDALGRMTSQTTSAGTFTFGYDGVSQRPLSVTYPNGQTTEYAYFGNAGDRLLQTIHHKVSGGATLSKFDYTYDRMGNPLTLQVQTDANAPVLWKYAHDAADQLVAAVVWSTGVTPAVLERYAYTYDAAGNRTAEQIGDNVVAASYDNVNRLVAQSPGGPIVVAGTVSEPAAVTVQGRAVESSADNVFRGTANVTAGTTTVTIGATDSSGNSVSRSYQIATTGTGRTFGYDAAGNMTSDGTRTYEWDAEHRLTGVVDGSRRVEFSYNGMAERVRRRDLTSGVPTSDERMLWAWGQIRERRDTATGAVTHEYSSHAVKAGATVRFLTRDDLGSVRESTDAAGTLHARFSYDPYGRATRVGGTEDVPFGFTGHPGEPDLGLVMAPHRTYLPEIGRWISQDPAGAVDGPNLYAYAGNSPLGYFDPSGWSRKGKKDNKFGVKDKDFWSWWEQEKKRRGLRGDDHLTAEEMKDAVDDFEREGRPKRDHKGKRGEANRDHGQENFDVWEDGAEVAEDYVDDKIDDAIDDLVEHLWKIMRRGGWHPRMPVLIIVNPCIIAPDMFRVNTTTGNCEPIFCTTTGQAD